MSDDPRPDGPRTIARSVGLGVLAFSATLILLFGFASLISRSAESPGATRGASATRPTPGATGQATASSPIGSGSTNPSASGDPVLVGAGDIADCALDSGAATAALLDTIEGTVFTAGDNAYPDGSAAQFHDCYAPTWGHHLERTKPTAGNHDWLTKGLAGYRDYFGEKAGPADASWYSFDLGAWHVIVLDSDCVFVGGCLPASPQGVWLGADLKASTAECTMAIWHHPRFSSGEHGNDASVWPFWDALYRGKADVVVNGHDHDYERFGPQDPAGREDKAAGIREFVVGTGGAVLRDFPTVAAHSEVRIASTFGVIRFVLHPTSYEWSFIATSGTVADSGTGPCH
jgi:Calcineurin-like phosphoesterase